MSSYHIYLAVMQAHKQSQMDAARAAEQARLHRLRAGSADARRSLRGRIGSRLGLYWSRVGGHRLRPGPKGRLVVLHDGSKVVIRLVRSTDAPLLADGFARLSARSRQMRFLTGKNELTQAELGYFTQVDHHDHEALTALNADGRGVGIARYVRDAGDPQAAEIAVTIADDWQDRGLGTVLLAQRTRRARCEGIGRFTALVSADNAAMAGLLRNVRAELVGRGPGTVEYEITRRRARPQPCQWDRISHDIRSGPERRRLAEMRFRVWLTQHLGAPATAEPTARAEDWLRVRADLLIAGMGGQVPVVVQLGVLAHADLGRPADLGRNSRRGSVRRAWGTEMARLAGDLAVLAATPERLAALQRNLLMPLELEALGGRAELSTRAGAIRHLRNQLPSPADRTAESAHQQRKS